MENTDTEHLNKLQAYWAENQAFPSMAKLCPVVGLTSTASVFEMVGRLVESGHLQRTEGRIAPTPKFFARPCLAFQGRQVVVSTELPSLAMPDPKNSFFVQVPNDQFSQQRLAIGDLLVMHRLTPVQVGDIALFQTSDSLQLGQLERLGAHVPVLKAVYESDPHFFSVDGRPETGLLGVAIGLVRRFDRPTSA
jgi:repressor LexA